MQTHHHDRTNALSTMPYSTATSLPIPRPPHFTPMGLLLSHHNPAACNRPGDGMCLCVRARQGPRIKLTPQQQQQQWVTIPAADAAERASGRPTRQEEPSDGPAAGEWVHGGNIYFSGYPSTNKSWSTPSISPPCARSIALYESALQAPPAKRAAERRHQQRRRSTCTKVLGQWDR